MSSLALFSLTLALIALHPPAWLGLWQVRGPTEGAEKSGPFALSLRARLTLLLRVEVALYMMLLAIAMATGSPLPSPLLVFLVGSHILGLIVNERGRPLDSAAGEQGRSNRLKVTVRAIFLFDAVEVGILLYFAALLYSEL